MRFDFVEYYVQIKESVGIWVFSFRFLFAYVLLLQFKKWRGEKIGVVLVRFGLLKK